MYIFFLFSFFISLQLQSMALPDNILVVTADDYQLTLPAYFWNNSTTLRNSIQPHHSTIPLPICLKQSVVEQLKNCFTSQGKINKEYLNNLSSFERKELAPAVVFLNLQKLEKPLTKRLKQNLQHTFNEHHVLPDCIDIINSPQKPLPLPFQLSITDALKKEVLPDFIRYSLATTICAGLPKNQYSYKEISFLDEESLALIEHNDEHPKLKTFNLLNKRLQSKKPNFFKEQVGTITHGSEGSTIIYRALNTFYLIDTTIEPSNYSLPRKTHFIDAKNIVVVNKYAKEANQLSLFSLIFNTSIKQLNSYADHPQKAVRDPIQNFAHDKKGNYLGAYTQLGNVLIWHVDSGKTFPIIQGKSGSKGLALHPTLPLIALEGPYHTINIWNFLTNKLLQNITIPTEPHYIAFSPSGSTLASMNYSGKAISLSNTTSQEWKSLNLPQLLLLGTLQKTKNQRENELQKTYTQLHELTEKIKNIRLLLNASSSLHTERHQTAYAKYFNELIKVKEQLHQLQKQSLPSLKSPFMMQSVYNETIFNSLPQTIQNYLIENSFIKRDKEEKLESVSQVIYS